MTSNIHQQEHDIVVRRLAEIQKENFDVLTNIDGEQNFVADKFPDVILLEKGTKKPLFIIDVRRNGMISQCMNSWKSVHENLNATLYIVVPEDDLQTAKHMAASLGLKAKFGIYKFENNNVQYIRFES